MPDYADDKMGDEPEEERAPSDLIEYIEENNLIDYLEEIQGVDGRSTREEVGSQIQTDFDDDRHSMKEWQRKYDRALMLAQMQPDAEKKTFPFNGASTAMLPFIQEAMIDFNARTVPELVYKRDVVNMKVYGRNTTDKEDRARRTSTYMNYQLSETIPSWRRNQDKMLLSLPCVGTAYKKTYWDSTIDDVRSELVLADEVVFDHDCDSFEEAPNHFHPRSFTKNELIAYIRGSQEWDISEEDDLQDDDTKSFDFIEAHCWYDLDGDGLEEPYMFMYWPKKSTIVYMTADYEIDDIILNEDDEVIKIDRHEVFTQYQFIPDPEGGPMGLGWGILMGPMFKAINTNVRQLIDAGTLANTAANSGLIANTVGKGRGGRSQSGPVRVKLGQLTKIDVGGMSGPIRDNVVQFPFAGPNQTLFELMEYLVNSARQLTAAAKQVDVSANQAASLYLAQLQQALKIPNAITMRVYDAATQEFKKIAHLNYLYYDNEKYNRVIDMQGAAESLIPQPQDMQQQALPPGMPPELAGMEGMQPQLPVEPPAPDFSMEDDFSPDDCDIRVVADPSQGSQMERAARADAILQEAKTQPQPVIDVREAYINWMEAMGVADIEKLAPKPDPNARDPMQEMMAAQMQMDAEFKQRDQMLREQDQMLKAQKMMFEAQKEMEALGLQDDKLESEIVKNYATALKEYAAAMASSGDQSLAVIQNLKSLIDTEEGGVDGTRDFRRTIEGSPAIRGEGAGGLAGAPGNPNIPGMP